MDYLALTHCLKAIRVSKFKRRGLSFNCNTTSSHTSEFKNNFILFGFKFLVLVFLFGFVPIIASGQSVKPSPVIELDADQLGSPAKPEVVGFKSVMTFSVSAIVDGVGAEMDNTFEWKVVGGKITGGNNPSQKVDYEGEKYEWGEITLTGWNGTEQKSEIEITWQEQTRAHAFIAVKQCSKVNGCTDAWSIYYIHILQGLASYHIELTDITDVCPKDNMMATVKITGGDKWSFVLMRGEEGDLNSDPVSYVDEITPGSPGVTYNSSLGYYTYTVPLATTEVDSGKLFKISIKNFLITLPESSGGNTTAGTIDNPDGLSVEVYQPPNTSPIEHN